MRQQNNFKLEDNKHILYIWSGAAFVLIATLFVLNFMHVFTINSANAETTASESTDMAVTLQPTLEVWTTDTSDVNIASLNISADPDAAIYTGTVRAHVSTNNETGYTLTMTSQAASAAMVSEDTSRTIAPISGTDVTTASWRSNASLNNQWAFSIGSNDAYNPVVGSGDTASELNTTSAAINDSTTDVVFGTKVDESLPAGSYTNTVIFSAVANAPAPTCPAYTICYDGNGADGGEMTDQATIDGVNSSNDGFTTTITSENASAVNLRAQNFWRSGYGFSGWNTKADGTGTQYGPMETIDMSDYSASGLSLYATWVASAGTLQSWSSCSSLTTGQVTALTDSRDNQTYAVAKLADGKCWMIENLRLGGASSMSLTTANTVTAGTLQASSNSFGTSYTVQQMNAQNTMTSGFSSLTASPGGENTGSAYWYGYGNFYSWPQAIMSTSSYTTQYQNLSSSLCPKSWKLPSGMLSASNGGDFGNLSVAYGGTQATMNASSTPTGADFSKVMRDYPLNFLYSGYWSGASAYYRGTYGSYWSSTVNNSSGAYRLSISSTYVYPGTNGDVKYRGVSVRCVTGS